MQLAMMGGVEWFEVTRGNDKRKVTNFLQITTKTTLSCIAVHLP